MSKMQLPESGFLRMKHIIGTPTAPGLIPVSQTTWLAKVKSREYPQPVRLTQGTIAWRVEDIRKLIEKLGGVS